MPDTVIAEPVSTGVESGTDVGTGSESSFLGAPTGAGSEPTTGDDPGHASEHQPDAGGPGDPNEIPGNVQQPEVGTDKLPQQYAQDKFVKGLFFANQELRKNFPGGVNEAIQLKQAVEKFGGAEAFAEFEELRNGWTQIDKDFAEGNPAVLGDIIGQSPDGFVKLVPAALDKLAEVDGPAYQHTLGKIFYNTLVQSGAVNSLSGLEAALTRKDFDGANAELAKVGKFLEQIQGLAMKVPEKAQPDPEKAKFLKEKADWEAQKGTEFRTGVLNDTKNYAVGKIETILGQELKSRGIDTGALKKEDPDSYNVLMRNCYDALNGEMTKDAQAFGLFQKALGANKRDDAVRLAHARVDQILKEASNPITKTIRSFYKVAGVKTPSAPTAQPVNGTAVHATPGQPGLISLRKVPSEDSVDRTRMQREFGEKKTFDMLWKGQGYLRGKKELHDWSAA